MKTFALAFLAILLVLAACGDDDTDAAAQTTTTVTTEIAITEPPATTATEAPTTTTAASDDTGDAAAELPEVVQRYYDALLDGDSGAVAALFTDDGVLEGPGEGDVRDPLSGTNEISSMMGIWFSYVDVTDIEVTEVITMGNTVVVVSIWSGDSSNHARGPGGDKTPYSVPAVDVFELDGDLIARCDAYFEYDALAN